MLGVSIQLLWWRIGSPQTLFLNFNFNIMNNLINIPFKCPYNDFSCEFVDTLTSTLEMDCSKCKFKINNMIEEKELEYRMYVLSLRQLSSINKACQGIHSCLEYANKYDNNPEYRKYIEVDKTLIMLDGGTYPDLLSIVNELENNDIHYASFLEPDLGNLITSICFIADERVWDKKYFHSFQEYYEYFIEFYDTDLQVGTGTPTYEEWLETIGGEKNAKLTEILSGKRLSL